MNIWMKLKRVLAMMPIAAACIALSAVAANADGKIYLLDNGINGLIQANLDGTQIVNLGNLGGTLDVPLGIALDPATGKMYVTNFGNNTVSVANLDGTGGKSLGNLGGTLDEPLGIAL